jgi:hypothetical protein
MQTRWVPALVFAVISLLASVGAEAGVSFNVDLNPFGWGAPPPPVVYEPPGYIYSAPPVVYYGHGRWGDHDWRRHDWHDRHHPHDHWHH